MKTIQERVHEAYEIAVSKGWHEQPNEFGTLIALMHSEITEAYEYESEDHLAEELADVLIRIFDLCGEFRYDLGTAIQEKVKVSSLEDLAACHAPFYWLLDPYRSSFSELLMQLHSRLSYTLEHFRKKQDAEIPPSLGDICILLAEIAHMKKLNLVEAVDKKMEKNRNRPYKHGGKRI